MMRKAIFEAIETDDRPKPKLSDENLLINELIREYLEYNNYLHTNSVLIAESGQPREPPFDRTFIAKELNIVEDNSSKKLPLLYSLIYGFKEEYYQQNPLKSNTINSNMNQKSMNRSSKGNSNFGMMNQQNNPNQTINSQVNNAFQLQEQPKPWVID